MYSGSYNNKSNTFIINNSDLDIRDEDSYDDSSDNSPRRNVNMDDYMFAKNYDGRYAHYFPENSHDSEDSFEVFHSANMRNDRDAKPIECIFCYRKNRIQMTLSKSKKEKMLKKASNTINMYRCAKCEKVYSCESCFKELSKHYNECRHDQPKIDIFSCLPNFDEGSFPRMDFTQLPDEYGGHIVNVYKMIYYDDCRLIFFRDCGYVLFENRNGGYWLTYSKIMDEDINKQKTCDKILSQVLKDRYPVTTYEEAYLSFLVHPKLKYPIKLSHYSAGLNMAIEYHGKQHHEYNQFYHGSEENFRRMQEDDSLKINLCKKHGVKLIIIPYNCDTYDLMKEYVSDHFFEY